GSAAAALRLALAGQRARAGERARARPGALRRRGDRARGAAGRAALGAASRGSAPGSGGGGAVRQEGAAGTGGRADPEGAGEDGRKPHPSRRAAGAEPAGAALQDPRIRDRGIEADSNCDSGRTIAVVSRVSQSDWARRHRSNLLLAFAFHYRFLPSFWVK